MLIFFLTIVSAAIIVSDPHCSPNINQYGTASISYDILARYITVSLDMTNVGDTYSCYLCETIGPEYCNSSSNNVALSDELSFNVLARIIGGPTQSYDTGGVANPLIKIETPVGYSCKEPLQLILVAFASIQRPTPFIFLVTLMDAPLHKMACNDASLLFEDIDCSVIGPYYYYVSIETPNCIREGPVDIVQPVLTNKPLLYWYNEVIRSDIPPNLIQLSLCGSDWYNLLIQSNLSYQCGDYASFYVSVKPWYLLAFEYIATRLNLANNEPSPVLSKLYAVTRDVLENTCSLGRVTEEAINDTVFGVLYDSLNAFNRMNDSDGFGWCDAIRDSPLLNGTDLDDGFIPFYVSLYKTWYFRYASFFILYSQDMEIKVIVALVLLGIASTVFLISLTVVPLWMIIVRCWRACQARYSRYEKVNEPVIVEYFDEL